MKHLKYSVSARLLAVLLAVLSAVATAVGGFTIFLTYETGLYSTPLEEVISRNFQTLQEFYSVKLYLNKENNPDCLENTNLEYGIIAGNSIENIDLNDKYAYHYYNFNATVPGNDSFVIPFYENQTECYNEDPTFWESLFNQYDYYIHNAETDLCQNPLKNLLYDRKSKIFYYNTPEYAFPVYHITLSSIYAEQKEDATREQSTKKPLSGYFSFTLNKKTLQYESDSGLFEPLDTTKYYKWQRFTTQSNYWFYPSDILVLSDTDLPPVANTNENDVWLTHNKGNETYGTYNIKYCINYYAAALNSSDSAFCIISNITEPLDLQKNDLFVQQNNALTFLYHYRIPCVVITACSFVCFLLLLAFCCYSTGCKADTDFVPTTWLHRLPLLIYLTVIGGCVAELSSGIIWCMEMTLHANASFLPICLLCLSLAVFFLIVAAMNISRRYKAGILWKNTLSCLLLAIIRHLLSRTKTLIQLFWQLFCKNTSLFLKGLLIFAITGIIELLIVIFTVETYGEGIALWIIFKIAELIIALSVLLQMKQLQNGSLMLAEGKLNHKLDISHMFWEFKRHGEYLNQIGDGMAIALEERMKSEHFRTELITNVSHDIKTPLTSIINYIDLLQKENISSESAKEYLEVLERQSARLKKLIEDLMEASKASTGNLTVNLEKCDIDILLTQIFGEFEEKLSQNKLDLITQSPDTSVLILADNRYLWRIFENLMNNICKYAQPETRVYVNWEADETEVRIIFRNISKYALTISGKDLSERFVRGDTARSTEGNGLGLSIAQSLAELMKGTLKIYTDGDLFKAVVTFPRGI